MTTGTSAAASEAKPAEGSLLNQEDAAPEVPAEYADFKVPEGFTLDKAVLGEATPLFKNANLTQEQAQAFVDFYTKHQKDAAEAPYNKYMETRKAWVDQVKAELGTGLPAVRAEIGRALNSLGLPKADIDGFRAAMDLTGAGDNPGFVKVFSAMAKRISEGRPVTGSGPAPVTKPGSSSRPTAAQALFPGLPSSAAAQ